MVIVLDGPIGALLPAAGEGPESTLWSPELLEREQERIGQLHARYAAAGATVHTAWTFRTQRRHAGSKWRALTEQALSIARASVPASHRVAGSIAPLEDCYRPDLSPENPRPEHREMARALAEAGADLLLCETFPHVGEAWIAVEEAVSTGLPVWVSFTAGPDGGLLSPSAVEHASREAVLRGAEAVLVNCIAPEKTLEYVDRLAGHGVAFGAYANAGAWTQGVADDAGLAERVDRYVAAAQTWVDAGASIVGSCCGTSPAHVRAIAARWGAR